MNKRIEDAIQDVVYWNKVFSLATEKLTQTKNERYAQVRGSSYLHLLASTDWLKQVYEEETGNIITQIGNLSPIEKAVEAFYL